MVHAGFLLTASALLLILFAAAPAAGQAASRQDTETLVNELRAHPWHGPHAIASPLDWDFGFTPPMLKLLEVGPAAQPALIEALKDPSIKDQAVILLGGLGDERAVGPIIAAMADEKTLKREPAAAARTNLAANIALTNITVADVIWHHGGGIVRTDPPPDSRRRWAAWWEKNRARFTVRGIRRSRRYSNYPNYGIYRQP